MIIENSLQFDLPHVNVAKPRRTARQHVKWQRRHDKTFDNDRMEYTYCLLKELERAGHVLLERVAKELHRHLPSLTYKDCDALVNAYMTPHAKRLFEFVNFATGPAASWRRGHHSPSRRGNWGEKLRYTKNAKRRKQRGSAEREPCNTTSDR